MSFLRPCLMDPATFLERYGFELEGRPGQVWVEGWGQQFPTSWIPAALLEALYQGRYKAASVEQILRLWQRRGAPHLTFPLEISQSLWREQQEQIRSLVSTTARSFARPPSPLPAPLRRGSSFSGESAISLDLLLSELQDLPPKLRHLLVKPQALQPARTGEAELLVTLELQQTVAEPPTPTQPSQGEP
ncbi:hypothetical protein [Synechococcus sp. OH2]|uniref:hypothetical protein n=2 Tax=unclassified Synechococcus TaxID=2626047 RepID=UPI0039C11FBE